MVYRRVDIIPLVELVHAGGYGDDFVKKRRGDGNAGNSHGALAGRRAGIGK